MRPCLDPLTFDEYGSPSRVPRSSSNLTTVRTSSCSRAVSPFHHVSNSSVYSTSEGMTGTSSRPLPLVLRGQLMQGCRQPTPRGTAGESPAATGRRARGAENGCPIRGTWYLDNMERVRIEAELPAALAEQARAFVAEGCASDLDELLAEALRRFLESRTSELTEAFMKEDVQWGLRGDD